MTLRMVKPASEVFRQLAAQRGLGISYAKTVADHVLIVDIKGQPWQEAVDRLAWAVYGEVSVANGTMTVRADTVAMNRARRTERQARIEANRRISRIAADRINPKSLNYEKDPARRMINRWVAALNPSDWAEYDPMRAQWRMNPNAFQRQLPAQIWPKFAEDLRLGWGSQPESPVDDFLLSSSPPLLSDSQIIFFGGPSYQAKLVLTTPAAFVSFEPELLAIPANVVSAVKGVRVVWGDRALMLKRRFTGDEEDLGVPRGPAPLSSFDPLEFGAEDAYFALANATKRSIVMDVSDDMSTELLSVRKDELSELLPTLWQGEIENAKDWIVSRPRIPQPVFGWQVPRRPYLALVAGWNQAGTSRIALLSDLLAAQGIFPQWYGVAGLLNIFVDPDVVRNLENPAAILWAKTSPGQRGRLLAGEALPMSSLSPAALSAVWMVLRGHEIKIDGQPIPTAFPSDARPNGFQGAWLRVQTRSREHPRASKPAPAIQIEISWPDGAVYTSELLDAPLIIDSDRDAGSNGDRAKAGK